MNRAELKSIWKKEEKTAYIKGWDFSHIHGRYEEENDLPWDYEKIVRQYLTDTAKVLDYDTGGGEFLLSLNHPFARTAATEGFEPNVRLCQEKLLPLGIDFKECNTPSRIPYDNETFDMIINRHGNFDARELYRLLKKGGIFVTQQVGGDNDRDLVEMVLPEVESPFPHLNLEEQRNAFVDAGFHILAAQRIIAHRFFQKRRMLTLFVLISRTVFKKYMMIQKASRRYYQRLRLENERRNNRFKIIRQQKNMER